MPQVVFLRYFRLGLGKESQACKYFDVLFLPPNIVIYIFSHAGEGLRPESCNLSQRILLISLPYALSVLSFFVSCTLVNTACLTAHGILESEDLPLVLITYMILSTPNITFSQFHHCGNCTTAFKINFNNYYDYFVSV